METSFGAGMQFGHALAGADPDLQKALKASGAGNARALAHLTDGTWEDALATARGLARGTAPGRTSEVEPPDDMQVVTWAGELLALQEAAKAPAAREARSFALRSPEDLAALAALRFRDAGGALGPQLLWSHGSAP